MNRFVHIYRSGIVCLYNDGIFEYDVTNDTLIVLSSRGHVIKNESGTAFTERSNLQIKNGFVSDDSTSDATIIESDNFVGTQAQWNALSAAEQAKYKSKDIVDDTVYDSEDKSQLTTQDKSSLVGAINEVNGKVNTSVSNFAPAYDSTATYAVDDLVTYTNKLYKCISPVVSPEAFNINKWDDVTTSEVYIKKRNSWYVTTDGIKTRRELLNELESLVAWDASKKYEYLTLNSDSTYSNKYILNEISTSGAKNFYNINFGSTEPKFSKITLVPTLSTVTTYNSTDGMINLANDVPASGTKYIVRELN